jgi:hypothetical protein
LKESREHALGLCLFAIEELGKAELLQGLSNSAKKYGEKAIILKRVKPHEFFAEGLHSTIDKLGFEKEKNPFYDHRYKLFYGSALLGEKVNERILTLMGSWDSRTFEELIDAYEKIGKDFHLIDIRETGFREDVMYVDYDETNKQWIHGTGNINPDEIPLIIEDVEKAIIQYDKNKK